MNQQNQPRVVAIDVRKSAFGHALFEGPRRLLDWGRGAISSRLTEGAALTLARKRIGCVLDLCAPSLVVIRNTTSSREDAGPIFEGILHEAVTRQIPVSTYSGDEVQQFFRVRNRSSKYEIYCFLVELYPELLPRLPPKRRVWQSERRVASMFDAVATGVAYWMTQGEYPVSPEDSCGAFPPAPPQLA